MRKFVIGFVSLCAVLGVYLLYNHLSSSPPLDADQQTNIIESATDPNTVSFDSNIGKIGDVGVGSVRKAKYITLNEDKQVEREFGFEKLLSEARDVWDIEKPYMNIFRRNFKCYITADKGKVQVETSVGRTTPKDATFTSNVVVRILFGPPDDAKESYLYLDNFVFLSEKSRLSTADPCDPVKFVSEDILMNGTGMELIYNEQTERLEYFKINDLDSLQIKGSSAAMFSSDKTTKNNNQTKIREPNEPLIVDKIPKAETSTFDVQPQSKQKQGVYYKCTFNKNVLVNDPNQLIFAGDKLCINDIFWPKSSENRSEEDNKDSIDDHPKTVTTSEPNQQLADNARQSNVTENESAKPDIQSGPIKSIVVTCDGGFEVVPIDSIRAQEDTATKAVEAMTSVTEFPEEFDNDTSRKRFYTQRIDYNMATGDGMAEGLSKLTIFVTSASGTDVNEAPVPVNVTARKRASFSDTSNNVVFEGDCLVTMPQSGLNEPKDVIFTAPRITVILPEDKLKQPDMFANGPAKLVFYMPDTNDPNTNTEPLPVLVNAQKQVQFMAASNQIVFEGDCNCVMLQEDPNALVKYILLSEQITVDLPSDSNEGLSGPAANIKHLTATGEVVRLAMTKTAKDESVIAGQNQDIKTTKLLSGVELKCSRFDYDAVQEQFLATGPGVIKFNNSEIPESNEPVSQFSAKKPCMVVMEGFDTLRYLIRENRIVADAGCEEKVRMNYFPVVDGRLGELIEAEASHIVALLYELPEGQTELSMLTATGGIKYTDKDKEFMGSELFYDHKTAILKVNGDETHPCYFNGALVDGIELNVETGKVKADFVEPGTLQINR